MRTDKGDVIYNKINETFWDDTTHRSVNGLTDLVLVYATLADHLEDDGPTPYAGHFYGEGGVNYLPFNNTSPTAYERFNNHYYNAVTAYKNGDKVTAYKELCYTLFR